MPYRMEWLTLAEAVEYIKKSGEGDPVEALRRACWDGNVPSRGLIQITQFSDRRYFPLGPEWWHAAPTIDITAGRITKASTAGQARVRAPFDSDNQVGPSDRTTIGAFGNDAESVQVLSSAVERIWPLNETAAAGNTPIQNLAMGDSTGRPGRTIESPTAAELEARLDSLTRGRTPRYDDWDHVDTLSVGDAACLWCDEEPEASFDYQTTRNATIRTYQALIVAAIKSGAIQVDHSGNVLSSLGNYARSTVSRQDLRRLAEDKGMRPKFLFPECRRDQSEAPGAPAERGVVDPIDPQLRKSAEVGLSEKPGYGLDRAKAVGVAASPAGNRGAKRPAGSYSQKRLRKWYQKWVADNLASGRCPSRDEEWGAAKKALGIGVPRDAVRALRRELAPPSWSQMGRRKSGEESGEESGDD